MMQQHKTDMCSVPYQTHFRNEKKGVNITDRINHDFNIHVLNTNPYINCNKCASNNLHNGVSSNICSKNGFDLNKYKAEMAKTIQIETIIRTSQPTPKNISFVPDDLCAITPSRPESCAVHGIKH